MTKKPAARRSVERRRFVSTLLSLTPDALVVTGLGSATYDVFAAGDRDRRTRASWSSPATARC
jgi:phosphonopyruvate decarboxylase